MSNKRHRLPAVALATVLLVASACSGDDDGEVGLVIDNATSSLQSILLLAQLAEVAFKVDRARINRPLRDARPIATGDLVANIGQLLVLLGCDDSAETMTDSENFVEVSVDCESTLFGVALQGRLLAELEFESVACGAEQCPDVLVWTLSSPDPAPFSYTAAAIRLEISRPAVLRFPVVEDGSRTLRADRVDVTNGEPFSAEVNATWVADACITMSLDTILTDIPGANNPAFEGVFPIIFSGQDVRVCLGRCPSEGEVFVSSAFGTILEWVYGATNVVEVFGPRIQSVEATLACAP